MFKPLVGFVALLAACASSNSAAPVLADAAGQADSSPDASVADSPEPDANASLVPSLSGEAAQALQSSTQLLAVVTPAWTSPGARVALFDRAGETWSLRMGPIDAQVGSKGLSWGRGLTLPPPGAARVKAEGDKTAPAGMMRLGQVMGYDAQPPAGLKFPYQQSTAQILCVDDPGSAHYNSIVDSSAVTKDWTSAETMLRPDQLYSLLALIDHNGLTGNPKPVPGAGSCIFLHLWSGPASPTIGCTAMDGEKLKSLLLALESPDKVVLVQLPSAEYQDAIVHWNVPQMPGE